METSADSKCSSPNVSGMCHNEHIMSVVYQLHCTEPREKKSGSQVQVLTVKSLNVLGAERLPPPVYTSPNSEIV